MSDQSPMPVTLEDALVEIRALRRILLNERLLAVKRVEKFELDKRSLKGEINLLKHLLEGKNEIV